MKTLIYFYTGTGNSLWTARTLAAQLGNTEIIPMSGVSNDIVTDAGNIGLVFPVHIWGLPRKVINFLDKLPAGNSKNYFALAVNAGQVAATLLQLDKLLQARGISLSAGFDVVMPNNYIPWGGPGPEEKQQERFHNARKKIERIAAVVKEKEQRPVEKGPLWQNILFTAFYKISFNQVPKLDKKFSVDEKCNGCGICEKVCTVFNIEFEEKKPVWQHRCEQCFACLQWCPQEAIQIGKKTVNYQRYRHPEVNLKDIMECVPEK